MEQLANGLNPIEEERTQRFGLYEEDEDNNGLVQELDLERLKLITEGFNDPRFYMIEFYSDRCPLCQGIAPQFLDHARTLKAKYGPRVKVSHVA